MNDIASEPFGWYFHDDPEKMAYAGSGFRLGKERPEDAINCVPLYTHPTTEPVKAQSITDAVMDVVDRLGSEWKEVDPRAWEHLRVYIPTTESRVIPEDVRKVMEMALDALSRNLIFMETPVERRTVQPWTQTVDSITALRNELNTAPKEMK